MAASHMEFVQVVFCSAGFIGNPMGFINASHEWPKLSPFISFLKTSFFYWQSPTGLITGMAQGSTSLLSNTGLTGLFQSPIKGAEKHGLPGVLSALGVTGLLAKPAASILEVTGKTAQSIRNRSRLYQMGSQRFRAPLPRPLSRELPLRPYSWEDAVGT
ncbi:vacuolar protein sorting-associated protein 13a [Quercus suber]|uniref:Vacuolar protein sorting-associated protein 13a n=1 Tax=Quercus suber TaxID=58331 RepID=A0AAW0JZN0_QUESU